MLTCDCGCGATATRDYEKVGWVSIPKSGKKDGSCEPRLDRDMHFLALTHLIAWAIKVEAEVQLLIKWSKEAFDHFGKGGHRCPNFPEIVD